MCAKFKGTPSEEGLQNIRNALAIMCAEIRRLSAENHALQTAFASRSKEAKSLHEFIQETRRYSYLLSPDGWAPTKVELPRLIALGRETEQEPWKARFDRYYEKYQALMCAAGTTNDEQAQNRAALGRAVEARGWTLEMLNASEPDTVGGAADE
jgi:hypothetical protein